MEPAFFLSECLSSKECQFVPLTSDKKSFDTKCVPNPAEVISAPAKIAAAWGSLESSRSSVCAQVVCLVDLAILLDIFNMISDVNLTFYNLDFQLHIMKYIFHYFYANACQFQVYLYFSYITNFASHH